MENDLSENLAGERQTGSVNDYSGLQRVASQIWGDSGLGLPSSLAPSSVSGAAADNGFLNITPAPFQANALPWANNDSATPVPQLFNTPLPADNPPYSTPFGSNANPEIQPEPQSSAAPDAPPVAPQQVETQDNNPNFQKGVELYQQGDKQGALKYITQAAQDGDAWAQTQLGVFYEQGDGVQQDYAQAAYWYQKAATNPICDPQAMKNLGQLYENGAGVKEDWVAAAQWYQQGAQLGNPQAEDSLAKAYQFGIGVPQDRAMAIQWEQRSVAAGDSDGAEALHDISDPTNFIGFRNEDERQMVLGRLNMPSSSLMVGGDPKGITFHNSAERNAWMQSFAQALANDVNQTLDDLSIYGRDTSDPSNMPGWNIKM